MRAPETHIAICGHAKHGKSTLAGRLLYELDAISDKEMSSLREEAISRGKDFNPFSLIFLKGRSKTFSKKTGLQDDQSRTAYPERGNVRLDNGSILTLIDTPGLSRFFDNIVYGIYLADSALLVVEASAGVGHGTINIARILSAFSTPIVAVFVTKMDVVGYSELRFQEVKDELKELVFPLLSDQSNYEPPVIPVSALSGVGFRQHAAELSWYSGKTALDAINSIQSMNLANTVEGTRFVVEGGNDVFSPQGVGTVLVGALESGNVNVGETLILEPASKNEDKPITIQTRFIQRAKSVTDKKGADEESISARAIVSIATSSLSVGVVKKYLRHGGMFGTLSNRPTVAKEIEADVIFFEPSTVYSGKEFVMQANASKCSARITSIERNSKTSTRLNAVPMHDEVYNLTKDEYDAKEREAVRARLVLEQPICIEASIEFQRLTRFLLREHNNIVACGRCIKIIR